MEKMASGFPHQVEEKGKRSQMRAGSGKAPSPGRGQQLKRRRKRSLGRGCEAESLEVLLGRLASTPQGPLARPQGG